MRKKEYEEPTIDLFSGEFRVETLDSPKKKQQSTFTKLISWAEERRGGKFVSYSKQMKALSMAKSSGIPPTAVMERWEEFENDKYWKEKGFDFLNVISSFDKRPWKINL